MDVQLDHDLDHLVPFARGCAWSVHSADPSGPGDMLLSVHHSDYTSPTRQNELRRSYETRNR